MLSPQLMRVDDVPRRSRSSTIGRPRASKTLPWPSLSYRMFSNWKTFADSFCRGSTRRSCPSGCALGSPTRQESPSRSGPIKGLTLTASLSCQSKSEAGLPAATLSALMFEYTES